MDVIAKSKSHTKRLRRFRLRALAISALGLSLTSCTSSLDFFDSTPKVDRSIATGTVPAPVASAPLSDEATVRNAVTSADLAKLGASSLPWANSATGSAGVVSSIRELHNGAQICRAFVTTRHSYEGIARFSGQACTTGSGDWLLTAFDRQ